MTREDKLYTMRGQELIEVAEKLGVKVNKKGNTLKEAKAKVIARILEAEEAQKQEEPEVVEIITPEAEEVQVDTLAPADAEEMPAPVKEKKPRKKREMSADVAALLEYVTTTWEALGGVVKTPGKENAVFRPLCAKETGRQVVKLMWTTKKISLFVRVEDATQYAETWQKINYALPYQCQFFSDTAETRKNISALFELVASVDSVRPKKVKTKKEDAAA